MSSPAPPPDTGLQQPERGAPPGAHGSEARARACRRFVLAAIAVHAAVTASLALARFASVHNETFDLALYARIAWGLVHAEAWDPIAGGNVLGGHMPWVLAPLGLLGLLFGTVPVLLVAQSVCAALAALPIARAAQRRLGPLGGAIAALSYLLYPNVGHVTTYEFHPGTLALLPLACALEVLDRPVERVSSRALGVHCALAVACRVSLGLQTALIGLLALRRHARLRRAGLAIALGSLAYFLLSLLWLQPAFGAGAMASADLHYGQWGGSPLGVLPMLVTAPGRVLEHLLAPERLSYPLRVLAPFALLPLLAPRYLLVAAPPLALNLLSAFPTAPELRSHYLTPAVPALAIGAIAGADVLAAHVARVPLALRRQLVAARLAAVVLGGLLLASLAAYVIAGGLPGALAFALRPFHADKATLARHALLARIPEGASVQAPDPLLPHLSERRLVHRAPPPERGTAYVALDVTHRRLFARQGSLLRTVQEPVVRVWLARPDHRVVFTAGDLILLQRGRSPRGGLVRRYFSGRASPDAGKALCACLAIRDAELAGKKLHLHFVARAACPHDLAIRFGQSAVPRRTDLLFDGLLSPAHLTRGDAVRSTHRLDAAEREAILKSNGLYVGAVRASGARPQRSDPTALLVRVRTRR